MQEGFKHIAVTAAEEEDEVILAGMHAEPEPESEPELESESPSEPTPSQKPKPVPTPARKQAEYRETMLEDLDSTPMPIAQKIVIIAAIVLIIVAVVYYFVAMR